MISEEKPMTMKLGSESESDSDMESDNEIEESVSSEMENVENDDELPEKFDLSKINQRLEEAPASSSEDEGNDEEEDIEEEDESDEDKGSGWADAMAKVLKIGKNTEANKPLLLSKAKLDRHEIPVEENKPREKASIRKQKKKELAEKGRKRPDIVKDRMKEKRLVRTATRGVVQLFNAVREQQKTLKTQLNKAGLSVTKRDKVYKNLDKDAFLQVLQSKKTSQQDNKPLVAPANQKIKAEDDDGTWSVLKDNFMMGAKMKDWDKDSDDDQGCD